MRFSKNNVRPGAQAFTLPEVLISGALLALVFGSIITAYIQGGRRAEWSGYSLAAQSLAIQQIEQARSAVWDNALGKNELTNLNLLSWTYNTGTKVGTGYSTNQLDLPITGTNVVSATNFVTVRMVYLNGTSNPPVQIQIVQVDTVWLFPRFGTNRVFTNTAVSYFAPDNRDATTL